VASSWILEGEILRTGGVRTVSGLCLLVSAELMCQRLLLLEMLAYVVLLLFLMTKNFGHKNAKLMPFGMCFIYLFC
jgi:hypothetical protein